MNGRNLSLFVCILFIIGIVWMILLIPKGETSRTDIDLFKPIALIQPDVATTPEPIESVEAKAVVSTQKETPPLPPEEGREEEEPETMPSETETDEPPDVVEYTPGYGEVTFTHMMHAEDYEIECGACHHEDMEDGMSKCANCHDSLKQVLHKNCQGCHKDLKSQSKDTGPVKCRECHIK